VKHSKKASPQDAVVQRSSTAEKSYPHLGFLGERTSLKIQQPPLEKLALTAAQAG
jgi:hypothetical protein